MAKFIHHTGTNGFGSAVSLMGSTDLNALSSGGTVTGSQKQQSDFASAQRALLVLEVLTAGWNVSAGGNLTGWFLLSPDAGSTYEATITNVGPARVPDFIIPLPTVSPIAAGLYVSEGPYILLPYGDFKTVILNNTGANTSSNNHTLKAYPVFDTYV